MKKLIVLLALATIAAFLAVADDTLIRGTGDTLHPIKASYIRIIDEKLVITERENDWDVIVMFLLENNRSTSIERVAFVTSGSDEERKQWYSEFSTKVNGVDVPFSIEEKDGVAYYISTIRFRRGITSVIHRYSFKGTIVADPASSLLTYSLTTGNNWNGAIGNISIYIILSDICMLQQSNSFFTLSGQSNKVKNVNTLPAVLVHGGMLHFSRENYVAKEEIEIHVNALGPYLSTKRILPNQSVTLSDMLNGKVSDVALNAMTKTELRILRNAIYAWYGFDFSSEDLQQYFKNFDWYMPYHKDDRSIPSEHGPLLKRIGEIESKK